MKLLLGGSLFFSVLHSWLLWDKQPGISVTLFCVSLLTYFIYFLNKNEKIKNKKGLILCVPIILLSLTYFIFNNSFFQILNIFVICGLWLILCITITGKELKFKNLITKISNLIIGPFDYFDLTLKEFKNLFTTKENSNEKTEAFRKILKSIIITIPIVIVVILLLTSADSIFANMFGGIGDKIEEIFTSEQIPYLIARIIVIAIIFIYMASFLYNVVKENTLYNKEITKESKGIKIEGITIQMILTVLNIIYLIFCTIQILYLFTKNEMALDFNYAEYARQGFFQLMFVSFINFALIFAIHTNKKETTDFQKKYTKMMEIVMEIFTQIIIISAFYRMFLYEQTYGYTYLRLFVYFTLITEFIFMLPTIWYTLGKKINLLKIGLTIVTIIYIALNYINVDSVIARNNINRYYKGKEESFDFSYLKYNTGTDAIPEIMKLLDVYDMKLQIEVKQYLKNENTRLQKKQSWQEWNISKQVARKYLENIE